MFPGEVVAKVLTVQGVVSGAAQVVAPAVQGVVSAATQVVSPVAAQVVSASAGVLPAVQGAVSAAAQAVAPVAAQVVSAAPTVVAVGLVGWGVVLVGRCLIKLIPSLVSGSVGGVVLVGRRLIKLIRSLVSGSVGKMMKAPGRNYRMPRIDFEKSPSNYFRDLRKK